MYIYIYVTHLTTGKPVETCLKAPNPLRLWNGPTEIWNLNSKKTEQWLISCHNLDVHIK